MDLERLKHLRSQAAVMQSDIDHDMAYFAEHINELDQEIEGIKIPIVRNAAGMVVVQVYLNGINRALEEMEEEYEG